MKKPNVPVEQKIRSNDSESEMEIRLAMMFLRDNLEDFVASLPRSTIKLFAESQIESRDAKREYLDAAHAIKIKALSSFKL